MALSYYFVQWNFFQLKFQPLQQNSMVYYSHLNFYSHSDYISGTLRFSAYFPGFHIYNRGQNF